MGYPRFAPGFFSAAYPHPQVQRYRRGLIGAPIDQFKTIVKGVLVYGGMYFLGHAYQLLSLVGAVMKRPLLTVRILDSGCYDQERAGSSWNFSLPTPTHRSAIAGAWSVRR
jgi:hypothetical protein